jgi:hypothetical protein
MDAFESLISMLLRHEGYWTIPSYKIKLTASDLATIGKPSSPRWEIDLIAYRAPDNEVLAVECKSFLDSRGVLFRQGRFENEDRYKLFSDRVLCDVVLARLRHQLCEDNLCAPNPKVTLSLAAGHFANSTDAEGLRSHFEANGWRIYGPDRVRKRLLTASEQSYENDIAFVSKLLLRCDNSGIPL